MKYIIALVLIGSAGCGFFMDVEPWGKSCSYVLPYPYRVVQLNNGSYCISCGGNSVMTYGWRYKDFDCGAVGESGCVTEFSDSCDAKGMIKYKLDQEYSRKIKP